MAFYAKDFFEIDNDELDFSIFLPNKQSIRTRGKINRRSPKSDFADYGLQYTAMTEDSNNILSSFSISLKMKKQTSRRIHQLCKKTSLIPFMRAVCKIVPVAVFGFYSGN